MNALEYAMMGVESGWRRIIIGNTAEFIQSYNSISRFANQDVLRELYQAFRLPRQAVRGILITSTTDVGIVEQLGMRTDECPDLTGWARAGLLILRTGASDREEWYTYIRALVSRTVAYVPDIPVLTLDNELYGALQVSGADLICRFERPNAEVLVFCDGSCTNNGKPGAYAGWAMYVNGGAFSGLLRSGRVEGPIQTNNRAEGLAILNALKFILADYRQSVTIVTDSNFMINVITKWLPGWMKRDPTLQQVTSQPDGSRGPAKNSDMMLELHHILASLAELEIKVEFEHVRSHKTAPTGIDSREYRIWHGNSLVDQLAKTASIAQ